MPWKFSFGTSVWCLFKKKKKEKYQIYPADHFWGFLVNHPITSSFISRNGCANPGCMCQSVICQRCSSRANWQACGDFIPSGKYSAFLPPNWKCQRRGAILSDNYWNLVIQSQWLMKAVNTFLLWSSKREHLIIHNTQPLWRTEWWELSFYFYFYSFEGHGGKFKGCVVLNFFTLLFVCSS